MIEEALHTFLTKSKEGDQIVFIVSGVLMTGKFIKYDHKLNIVHLETKAINGKSLASNITVLDRAILAWGNPINTMAGAIR